MRYVLAVMVVLLLMPELVDAQTTGTCTPALGEAYLDVGNVRARILNNDNLFWGGYPNVYEVPKGGGESSVFTAGLWVGGFVEDSLRIAGARYGSYEFWAGPLDDFGNPPYDCSTYDRIASIYREDIERYERLGAISNRLRTWPWQWGAPVVDGDGKPNNYNLAGGDRPELLGDQTLWWVMNDRGNEHLSTDSPPMGMQVSVAAFAFNTLGAIGNSTFYRYRLHYKGEAPLEEAYVTMFLDTDLGDFDDDYIASDTTLGMAYTYNSDNDDEGHYGEAPPALGVSFLQGPMAEVDGLDNDRDGAIDESGERLRATNVAFFNSGGNVQGDPQRGTEYYHYMRSRWKDGKRFTVGGGARSFSNTPTSFVFPGDPIVGDFWSEYNADDAGTANTPADRRFLVSTGPFRMEPGEVEEIVVAIVWSRGTSNLDSVRKLREDMAFIYYTIGPQVLEPRIPEKRTQLGYHRNYPNPFAEHTTIRYGLERPEHVTLTVYDMLGRKVATLVDAEQDAGWHEVAFDADGLLSGAYVYRLQVGFAEATETMMVVR